MNPNWSYSPETPNLGQIWRFFEPCDLEIWWMTLKNNRAPLLCYSKLCSSFRSHWWIQTWVTVPKRPIWVKIDDFFSRVTSKFDVWPRKTIGHLFYATSSFVHHFIAIGEFKLELKSRNAQSWSNSTIFSAVWPWNLADDLEHGKSEGFDSCDLPANLAQILSKSSIFQPVWPWNFMHDLKQGKSEGFESCHQPIIRKRPIWVKIGDVLYRVTLKFDGWPWKTIGHLSFAVSSFVQHFIAIDEFKLELKSGNAQFGSKSMIFLSRVTLQFDVWPWKTIGHLFYATSSFVHHLVAIGDFKLELQSENAQFGSNSMIFRAVWPWNLMDDLQKQ